MVDTLDESTAAMERRVEFEAEAAGRWAEYRRTGDHYVVQDMRSFILVRARDEVLPKQPLRKDPQVGAPKRRR